MRWISSATLRRKLNGLWFECCVKRFPDRVAKGDSPWRYDFAEGRMICKAHAWDIYRDPVFCAHKRQLSSRELKRLGLRNDAFPTGSDSGQCSSVGAHCPESKKLLGQASSLPAIPGTVLRVGWFQCRC